MAADDVEDVLCTGVEVEERIVAGAVTAMVPTENVVERPLGAGSSNISFVGESQLTVLLSDSVPQQDQTCDILLYTMSTRYRSPVAELGRCLTAGNWMLRRETYCNMDCTLN